LIPVCSKTSKGGTKGQGEFQGKVRGSGLQKEKGKRSGEGGGFMPPIDRQKNPGAERQKRPERKPERESFHQERGPPYRCGTV